MRWAPISSRKTGAVSVAATMTSLRSLRSAASRISALPAPWACAAEVIQDARRLGAGGMIVRRLRCEHAGGRDDGIVARAPNGGDQVGDSGEGGITPHRRALCRKVDARLRHAGHEAQRRLDSPGAGCAGHAIDGQVDGFAEATDPDLRACRPLEWSRSGIGGLVAVALLIVGFRSCWPNRQVLLRVPMMGRSRTIVRHATARGSFRIRPLTFTAWKPSQALDRCERRRIRHDIA